MKLGCPPLAAIQKYGAMALVSALRRGDKHQVHGGTRNEFVSRASLISASSTKSGDYHDAMNGENSEHWLLTQLLPNLEEPLLVIMDNASYHSVLLDKPPTQSWIKDQVIAWL
jgi:hypothetical protein